jgi:wyosine [tRNA(Phe)-imidazoG37] synthetase (radical SAM superfamily)
LNEDKITHTKAPRREAVYEALKTTLSQMVFRNEHLDVITFAGNGEPTLHPDFPAIIDDALALRDRFFPYVKVAVLSNSTMIFKEEVFRALCRVDDNIMKLDSVIDDRMQIINQPESSLFTCEELIRQLLRFDGNLIIQTMFLHGEYKGVSVDNTGDNDIVAWIKALKIIRPRKVMIYTIDRETPIKTLRKVSPETLEMIADCVRTAGFEVSVAT